MSMLIFFFVFCQALGASVGAIAALWGEIAYVLAIRDGKLDAAERKHLNIIYKGLRFGMAILLVSSTVLVIISYVLHGTIQPATTTAYWIFIALALLVIGISWALARRDISYTLGSSSIFAAWWLLAYLTLGQLPMISFGFAVMLYVVLTAIMYAVFRYVHMFALHKKVG
jgi:hypothetical protein